MNIKIPAPLSGGLLLSYKCTAACRHCMYACSPRWKADWISEEDLEGLLQFAVDYGYHENENGYYSKCHLCTDIRKYLIDKDDFKELKPEGFYTNLE